MPSAGDATAMETFSSSLTETPVPAVGEDRLLGVPWRRPSVLAHPWSYHNRPPSLTTHWLFLLLRLCLLWQSQRS